MPARTILEATPNVVAQITEAGVTKVTLDEGLDMLLYINNAIGLKPYPVVAVVFVDGTYHLRSVVALEEALDRVLTKDSNKYYLVVMNAQADTPGTLIQTFGVSLATGVNGLTVSGVGKA